MNFRHRSLLLLSAGVALALVTGAAVAKGPTPEQVAAVTGAKVKSMRPVPEWPGLYEVIDLNDSVYYVNEQVTHVVAGQLIDLHTLRNLSQESLDAGRAMAFDSLPLQHAIVRRKGNGTRRLAVFADPDCPFCEKLEHSLRDVTDVTIYVLPYPLEELHPGATEHMRAIWCAASPADAWDAWMLRREAVAASGVAAQCEPPIAAVREFAERAGIGGTPLLVFPSGRVVYGSLAPVTLEYYLNEPKP
jgi:thiol:disulfide interchange protein DsbC